MKNNALIIDNVYNNLDEAWLDGLYTLAKFGNVVMNTKEKIRYNMQIIKPYNNLLTNELRTTPLAYAIGEIIWYLSGSNKLKDISYYSKFWERISDDNKTVRSAYGHRIFNSEWEDCVGNNLNFSQWKKAIVQLVSDPENRQTVINLNLPHDKNTKDEICTIALQFLIRNNKLNLCTIMRSNDIVRGTTFDIYCFTMIQQLMLLELKKNGLKDLKLGSYYHTANSFHIYNRDFGLISNEEDILIEAANTENNDDKELILDDLFLFDVPYLIDVEGYIKNTEHKNIDDLLGKINIYIDLLNTKYAKNMIYVLMLYKLNKFKEYKKYIDFYNNIKDKLIPTFKFILDKDLEKILEEK